MQTSNETSPNQPASGQLPSEYEAALTALAPYLKEMMAGVAEDTASIRQELEASEPETLLTQLTDVAQEMLELVEILASRALNQEQLNRLKRLELTANNAVFQVQDFCESFEP